MNAVLAKCVCGWWRKCGAYFFTAPFPLQHLLLEIPIIQTSKVLQIPEAAKYIALNNSSNSSTKMDLQQFLPSPSGISWKNLWNSFWPWIKKYIIVDKMVSWCLHPSWMVNWQQDTHQGLHWMATIPVGRAVFAQEKPSRYGHCPQMDPFAKHSFIYPLHWC